MNTLLQAIARVNRPFPGKESGLIVDYIGILENLQRALAFDVQAVSKALIDLAELKSEFAAQIERIERNLDPLNIDQPLGRVERIIDHFFEPETRDAFVGDYKALQAAYEILSPDPFLRNYIDRYASITDVYLTVYGYFNPESERRRLQYDLLQKTDHLIRKQVEVTYLAAPLPEYPITRDIARVVEADQVSDQVKIINLYRSVVAHVEANKTEQPYLVSIGEEVEAIIERLHGRQISTQLALSQIETQVEQAARAHEEQTRSDLSGEAFAVYWVIKGHGVPQAQAKAEAVAGVLATFPDWPYNDRAEQHARLELYKLLMDAVGKDAARLKAVVDDVLKMHRMANG